MKYRSTTYFPSLELNVKKLSKVDYSNYVIRTEKSLSTSLSNFWKYLYDLIQNPPIPSSVYFDNIHTISITSSANLFNTHFSSTYNPPMLLWSQFNSNVELPYDLPSDIHYSTINLMMSYLPWTRWTHTYLIF